MLSARRERSREFLPTGDRPRGTRCRPEVQFIAALEFSQLARQCRDVQS